MLIQNQVGPITANSSISAGTQVPGRAGQLGDVIVSALHGRYYESCYRRNVFAAANAAGVVTTIAFTLAYTGLIISNPVASMINCVLLKVGYAFMVLQPTSGVIVGVMTGYNSATNVTHTAAVTPKSCFVGVGANPICLVDSSATMPTAPTLQQVFGTVLDGSALTITNTSPLTMMDLEGSIILPPGGYAAIYTTIASGAASMMASFIWEELPL